MNPLDALASLLVGIYKARKVQQSARELFQMVFSAVATFLVVAGAGMSSTGEAVRSIGAGLLFAGVVLVYFFRRASFTKGMMAVLPESEAADEMKTDFQVIQK